MKNTLSIDTSKADETLVRLTFHGEEKKLTHTRESNKKRRSQTVLFLIDKILTENNLSLKDLDEIQVNPGPGSFTGLRVGVSIANTLALVLGIPINGKSNHLVEPIYA